jgi:hypothetical protein
MILGNPLETRWKRRCNTRGSRKQHTSSNFRSQNHESSNYEEEKPVIPIKNDMQSSASGLPPILEDFGNTVSDIFEDELQLL